MACYSRPLASACNTLPSPRGVLPFYPSVSQPELSFSRQSWPLLVDLLTRFTSKDCVPMPGPEDDFEPTKALLNPFFESYRLESDVLDLQEVATFKAAAAPICRVLQGGDGESRLGWREAKSRAAWNHLCVSTDAREAAWIDQEAVVWLCSWDDKVHLLDPALRITDTCDRAMTPYHS